jgi:hypothetical protein
MRRSVLVLVGVALVVAVDASPGQNSRISWYGLGGSFAASTTRTMIARSVLGQGFAGAMHSHDATLEAGFLADTLFRSVVTGVPGFRETPERFTLYQNFPNPFNPRTRIRYDVPRRSAITIAVFTILGQRVVTLMDGVQDAGTHEVEFDGAALASGVYFCRLVAEHFVETRKLMVLR